MENIAMEVEARVSERPDAPALAEWDAGDRERRLTFREFGRRTAALSAALAEAGVGKGDRVLLLIPMSVDLYVSILAVIRLGAVCVFVDPYMGARRFNACCGAVEPKAFIGIPKAWLFWVLCSNLRKVPLRIATHGMPGFVAKDLQTMIHRNLGKKMSAPAAVRPEDSALISFTTGSSGEPKGSNRTHAFLRGQLRALDLPEKNACASDFPGFPILPLENLAHGRLTFIPRLAAGKVREAGGGAVLRQLLAWRPEMMSGSPAYLEAVADGALRSGVFADSVKLLYTGGAPITAKALEKLAEVWRKASINVVYGSTEAEPVSSIPAGEILGECRLLSQRGLGFCVGYPTPVLEVIVVPLDFMDSESSDLNQIALPTEKVGEIAVRGPHVNTGYWNNPQGEKANKIRTPQGIWHRMGDAGYFDRQGRLWVVGRAHAAMANPKFKNPAEGIALAESGPSTWPRLFPYQAECIVDEFSDVRKSAYTYAYGKFWLVAETADYVGVLGGKTELESKIRAALADFPLDEVRFHPHLPVDPRHNSKVEYAKLSEWLRGRNRTDRGST